MRQSEPASPPRKGGIRAFTLPELMIVVFIITVAIALLLPVFSRTQESAKAASCLGNLRNYGVAVFALAADGNGLPRWNVEEGDLLRFANWLQPYLKVFPRCPLAGKEDRQTTKAGLPQYGFNYDGNGNLCQYYRSLKGIPVPASRVVLAAECHGYNGFYIAGHLNRTIWGNDTGSADPGEEESARRTQYHGTREKRGLHFFFLDGHAKLVYPTDNDWREEPTLGSQDNDGYFYHNVQFRLMSKGLLTIP